MLRLNSRSIVAGILMFVGSFAGIAQSKGVDPDVCVLVDAPGHVFYKDKEGAMVKRDVTLSVPPCGEGELVLSAGDWKAATTHFFTYEAAGRVVFTAVFIKPFPSHSETSLVLTGSYMRGTNKAVYWGDMFKTHEEIKAPMMSLLKTNPEMALGSTHFHHVGGFKFKAEVAGGEPTPPPPSAPSPEDPNQSPNQQGFSIP